MGRIHCTILQYIRVILVYHCVYLMNKEELENSKNKEMENAQEDANGRYLALLHCMCIKCPLSA